MSILLFILACMAFAVAGFFIGVALVALWPLVLVLCLAYMVWGV